MSAILFSSTLQRHVRNPDVRNPEHSERSVSESSHKVYFSDYFLAFNRV